MTTQDNVTPSVATALVNNILQDEGYRWSWWCNLVMCAVDAGASRETAENAAERFLGNLSSGGIRMDLDPYLAKDRIDRYGQLLVELNEDDEAAISAIKETVEILKKRNGRDALTRLINHPSMIAQAFDENHWASRRFGSDLNELFDILISANDVLFPIYCE